MNDDLIKMLRVMELKEQRDERLSTGALYGEAAEHIVKLEAENKALRDRDIEVTREGSKHSRRLIAELKAEVEALKAENAKLKKLREWDDGIMNGR